LLPEPNERQAEEFAYGLLVDEAEARREGFTEAWQVAEHFGVPEQMVRVQGRLL
jgi:Zn-dependent peptidase ImmA (M78 family)